LAQHFKHATRQFRHLVQEEHPVVGEADFTRLRIVSTTYQSHDASIRF